MPPCSSTCSCHPRRSISISRPFHPARLPPANEASPGWPAHIGNKGYAASLRAAESAHSLRARESAGSGVHAGLNVGGEKVDGEKRTAEMGAGANTPVIVLTLVCGREVAILGRGGEGDECCVGGGREEGMQEGREGGEGKTTGRRKAMKAWARFRRLVTAR